MLDPVLNSPVMLPTIIIQVITGMSVVVKYIDLQ